MFAITNNPSEAQIFLEVYNRTNQNVNFHIVEAHLSGHDHTLHSKIYSCG